MVGSPENPFAKKYGVTEVLQWVEGLEMGQEMMKLAPQRLVALLSHVHGVLEKQKAKARVQRRRAGAPAGQQLPGGLYCDCCGHLLGIRDDHRGPCRGGPDA